jgi:hypothetical protein
MRRFTVLLVLAFALALPAIASATEVGGSVSESFTLEAPTISMTVPLATVYGVTDGLAIGGVTLTDIGTSNTSGLTITARFSVLSKTLVGSEVTPVTIPTTSRLVTGMSSNNADLTIVPGLSAGTIADDATWYDMAWSTVSLTGASAEYFMQISGVTVPGDYTGTIDFLASTNP